jgi:hypothetical protein
MILSWPGLLIGLAGFLAQAQDPASDEEVKVTVAAILATERGTDVDPKLECLAREVKKIEPGLTGFRVARATCKSLQVGISYQFPLVDGKTAWVVVQHPADEDNRVSLMVKPPQLGEITYTSTCGKYFPIVTRYQTKDKDRLIVAIMIRSCK